MRSARTSGHCPPWRRPSCSQDGAPFLVTGSPGGPRIITTTLQIIMNVIDHGMNIAEATYAPRIHHQWLPDELRIEEGLSPDTIRLLEQKGHRVAVSDAMGSTQSIMVTDSRPVRQLRSAHSRRAHARLLRERARAQLAGVPAPVLCSRHGVRRREMARAQAPPRRGRGHQPRASGRRGDLTYQSDPERVAGQAVGTSHPGCARSRRIMLE